MKITDERITDKVKFCDLPFGKVFEYKDIEYMKTHEVLGGDYDINAVDINDGSFEFIDNLELVEILNTELVIRE